MNLNELAREISKLEGKKVELSIAQIKEVLRCLGDLLAEFETAEAFAAMARLAGKKK